MRIFLTGATGFIGSVLMRQLINDGHIVHVLYRSASFNKVDLSHSKILHFKGDLLNFSSLEQAMRGCEQAYHLAAYARVWAPDPLMYHNINVIGTRNVLQTALRLGLDKVVVTSSAATLPASENGDPVNETAVKKSFETQYARSKYLAEEEVRVFHQKGLHTVIVNPTRVYGPGLLSESNAVTKLIKWYLQGRWRFLPGDGSFIGNYAYVGDVAWGHQKAMKYGKSGNRYIIGGENISLRNFFQFIGHVSGKNRKLLSLPLPMVKTFAKAERWKADAFNLRPLITPQWIENYLKDSPLSSAKAKEELNYTITPMAEGLENTIHWLRPEL